jgi:hypothetical protein
VEQRRSLRSRGIEPDGSMVAGVDHEYADGTVLVRKARHAVPLKGTGTREYCMNGIP